MSMKNEFNAVWDLGQDQLLERLGLTAMGTNSVDDSLKSYNELNRLLTSTDKLLSTRETLNWIKENGKEVFEKTWATIKSTVCDIYRGKTSEKEPDQDLAATIGAAVIAAFNISNVLVVLIVTIAIKKGLNVMCPIDQ